MTSCKANEDEALSLNLPDCNTPIFSLLPPTMSTLSLFNQPVWMVNGVDPL